MLNVLVTVDSALRLVGGGDTGCSFDLFILADDPLVLYTAVTLTFLRDTGEPWHAYVCRRASDKHHSIHI